MSVMQSETKADEPPASGADSPVTKAMRVILARETTPETIDESVSDDEESLPTGDPSLGKASSPPPALPFDESSTTRKAKSDKETANFFRHSNEASSDRMLA